MAVAADPVWVIWFTHSHCDGEVCAAACDVNESSRAWKFEAWPEAAAAIEHRLITRADGCDLDAIVSRIPRAEWLEIENDPETTE